jgi:hypothetical protein
LPFVEPEVIVPFSFRETLTIGLFSASAAGVVAWLGYALSAFLQRHNDRVRYRREKLLERYSEFVGSASAVVELARQVESYVELVGGKINNADLEHLQAKRHELRSCLSRVAFQIRLFEHHQPMKSKVQDIANSQPYLMPNWGQTNYTDQFEQYKDKIALFEKKVIELTDAVLRTYSSVKVWPTAS